MIDVSKVNFRSQILTALLFIGPANKQPNLDLNSFFVRTIYQTEVSIYFSWDPITRHNFLSASTVSARTSPQVGVGTPAVPRIHCRSCTPPPDWPEIISHPPYPSSCINTTEPSNVTLYLLRPSSFERNILTQYVWIEPRTRISHGRGSHLCDPEIRNTIHRHVLLRIFLTTWPNTRSNDVAADAPRYEQVCHDLAQVVARTLGQRVRHGQHFCVQSECTRRRYSKHLRRMVGRA